MIWLAWRQFRTQALVALGLLAAFAALIVVTGLQLHHIYSSLGGERCWARSDCRALTDYDPPLQALLGPALLAIPALLGMFWGAPMVARELESGTWRLAWTQSVTRRRWLSVRVALVGLAALAVAGLASWLISWWFAPLDAIGMNRLDPSVFTARGIVAIGYAGFAFALGVASGMLMRRTLSAVVTTLVGFVAARIAVTLWVRPDLLPARQVLDSTTLGKGVAFFNSGSGGNVVPSPPPLPNTWTTGTAFVDRANHILSGAQLHALLSHVCPTVASGRWKGSSTVRCQVALSHHVRQLVTYQPASHFWPLQGLETAIFLTAALAVLGPTVWLVGRRRATQPMFGERYAGARDWVALKLAPEDGVASVRRLQDSDQSR